MAEEPTSRQPTLVRTPRQQRLHRRLGLIGEGPQAFYADILRIVSGELVLASGSNVGGHLLREMESALRDALEPITQHRTVALQGTRTKNLGGEPSSHASEISTILRALAISETEGIGADWLDIAAGEVRPHKVAHRRQFNRPSRLDQGFVELWERFEPVLDVVLEHFESRYVELYRPIDALLAKPEPSGADLDYLGKHLPNNPVIRFHFFEALTHPGWLKPLQERGYFRDPPRALTDESTKTTSFDPWAPPVYLQRMAALPECHQQVLEIALALPDVDNFYVHDGIVKAVEGLPSHLAVQTVPLIVRWLGTAPAFGLLPERLGALAVVFARAGYVTESLQLLRALLAIKREETKSPSGRTRRRSASVIQDYEYSQVLKESIPALLELAPDATVEMMVALLDQALEEGVDGDLSWIWRGSIQQANRGSRYKVKDLLIDAIRDAALMLCRAEPDRLRSVVAQFEARAHSVWHRMALFLLAQMPEVAPDLVHERLLMKERFDAWRENPEYVLLLRSAFSLQKPEVQEIILNWIETGPHRDDLASVDSDKAVVFKKGWQYRRLRILEGQLRDEWARRLKAISPAEKEEEEESGAAWVGRTSPLTHGELGSMPVGQVAEYLRSWNPPSDTGWRRPSPDGLGTVLSTVVGENPASFSEQAAQFVGLEPTYVRSILDGFAQAVKQSKSFNWRPVLELCEWVVAQPCGPERPQRDRDRDPGWSWSRKAVAGLLRAGMDAEVNQIRIQERELVWKIVEPLTWDLDPLPDCDVDRDAEGGFDMAINSVRGEAMIAAIRYGVWVKKATPIEGTDALRQMPELLCCLDQHLDPDREGSIAIWAVFGESFPVLGWIDRGWAQGSCERIFAAAPKRLREAAWANYVKWNRPYDDVFPLLIPFYREHVNQLSPSDDTPEFESAVSRLVRHLMAFYWRGIEGTELLVDEFFERAGIGARHEAFDFIGQGLPSDETIAGDVQARLGRIWERNIASAAAVGAGSKKVLEPFGWWLSSGKLDLTWSLQQAEHVIAAGATLEPDHVVVEYLETIAKERPLEVARILAGLVENIENEWSVHGWRDHAMAALRTVMASDNLAAVAQGRVAINRLVARGHTRYRALLSD